MMSRVFLALGSNIGDRKKHLERAVSMLESNPSVSVVRRSSVVETDPVGGPPQGKFFNQVIEIETCLSPQALLAELKQIEQHLGRKPREKWGPRTIDLDILMYDDLVLNSPDLKIPHPLAHRRLFVLGPLSEIAGEVIHPVLGKSIADLLKEASRETSKA